MASFQVGIDASRKRHLIHCIRAELTTIHC
jgi:hypothetical protein